MKQGMTMFTGLNRQNKYHLLFKEYFVASQIYKTIVLVTQTHGFRVSLQKFLLNIQNHQESECLLF